MDANSNNSSMFNKGIFDPTTQLLQANLDRRTTQHRLITRNLANIDTPNYHGTGLEFEKQLRTALEGGVLPTSMARTNSKHLPTEPPKPLDGAAGVYKDIGSVHMDIEMTKLAENNIMYQAMVQLLNKKYNLLKTAINESAGGR